MSDPNRATRPGKARLKTFVMGAAVIFFLLVLSLFVLLKITLQTPAAANSVSKILSTYLQHKVTVAALSLSGTTLHAYGAIVEAPPGFHERHLLSAREIRATPDLKALLTGKRGLARLEIDRLKINLEKQGRDRWNFTDLAGRLTRKKTRPTGEVTIGYLAIRNATISLNGKRLSNLGLTLHDFSNKGSSPSSLVLGGKDSAGNPFRLLAEARPGPAPAYHVSLAAPVLSLTPMQLLLPDKSPVDVGQASARIVISADFRGMTVSARGKCGVDHLGYRLGGSVIPLKATLDFASRYDSATDEATLSSATVTINEHLRITGSAIMHRVKQDGNFTLRATPQPIDIEQAIRMIPEQVLHGFTGTGNLTFSEMVLEGTKAQGITGGSAKLSGREIALLSRGRSLLRNGAIELALKGTGSGWDVHGRALTVGKDANALVANLLVPFSAQFSQHFRPLRVDLPKITASPMGVTLSGHMSYVSSARTPFSASCTVTDAPVASLNRFLQSSATHITAGTFAAAARLSGASPRKFSGEISTRLSSVSIASGGKRIFLKNGTLRSEVHRDHKDFSAHGHLKTEGGIFDEKPVNASLGFALANRNLQVREVVAHFDRTAARVASASLHLPGLTATGSRNGLPLSGSFTGLEIRQGDFAATGMDGHFDCSYRTGEQDRQLTGTGDITIKSLGFAGQTMASLQGGISFTGNEVAATIKGESLGGSVDGRIRSTLFTRQRSVSFSARLHSQRLAQLGKLLATSLQPRPSAGTVDAAIEGSLSSAAAVNGRVTLNGRNIALANAAGRTILTGMRTHLDATMADGSLVLAGSIASQDDKPSVQFKGQIAQAATTARKGRVSFSMGMTPLNSLLDTFVAVLPGQLQEAVCEGTCALDGTADLNGRNVSLQTNIALDNAAVEISSKKLRITDISGQVPLSLVFPWPKPERKAAGEEFSRENYNRLRNTLQQQNKAGRRLQIGSLRFGAFETGRISAYLSAGTGVTELSSIEVSLYQGKLLGKGRVTLKDHPEFGVNLLLEGLSLKEFCNSIPSIKGYITGRVDGIISLLRDPENGKGLIGYVNLWTRRGDSESMLVSREFLQKLAGKKLQGFLFSNDRAYDTGEIGAYLQNGYLTFEKLDISHTNFFGMKDLNVTVVPVQNRISLEHLLESIREAAARGKRGAAPEAPPAQTDLNWLE